MRVIWTPEAQQDRADVWDYIATNTRMYERLKDDMDINCGGILDGTQTLQQTAQEIFDNLLRSVSGEKSRSEILGLGDHEFVPWNIGVTG